MSNDQKSSLTRDESTKLRRELIIHTALECFAVKGFHQTSIRDIANKAEISLGNLYNYFDSKEALILEIANIEAEDIIIFERLLADSDDPLKAIERFVDAYLKEVTQPFYAVLATEIFAEAMRNTEIAEKLIDNRSRIIKALVNVLSAGVDSKKVDPNILVEVVAELIIDAIEGLAFRSALQGKKVNSNSRKALHWNIQKIICFE